MGTTAPCPDGGFWGWIAVFACFMGNVIGDGVMYSFGIFTPNFKDYFGCGSGQISTVNAIQMGVTFAAGPLASYMTTKLGWRLTTVIGSVCAAAGLALSSVAPNVYVLYVTGGGLIGLGLGVIYVPRLDCITQYFDKWRPIVTGFAICGSGIGTFVLAPLTEWMIEVTDWKTALLFLSGLCLTNCLFGLLFKPLTSSSSEEGYDLVPTEEKGDSERGGEDKNIVKDMILLLRNWVFMLFAVSNFLTSLGYPIPYAFVPDNAKVLGLTSSQGGFLVGIIGISNTVARVLLGIISHKLNRLFLYNTFLVLCGISMALTNWWTPLLILVTGEDCPPAPPPISLNSSPPFPHNSTLTYSSLPWACDPYVGQMIYANLYGISSAAYVLLTTLVLADLLGQDRFTNAFGLLLLFQGVATFIGPPIVGFMYDAAKSYNSGFILMGAMIALSGLILYPIPCIQSSMKSRERMKPSKSVSPL